MEVKVKPLLLLFSSNKQLRKMVYRFGNGVNTTFNNISVIPGENH
jgi:hypothetical protein